MPTTLQFTTHDGMQAWAKACDKKGWKYSRCNHSANQVTILGLQPDHLSSALEAGASVV